MTFYPSGGASTAPSGPAGGVLAGTYPSPSFAAPLPVLTGGAAGGVLAGTYPNPGLVLPSAQTYGLSFWTVDPFLCAAGNSIPAQLLLALLTRAVKTETINKLGTWVKTAGVTAGTGINGLAIYSAAGSLLGQTGDMTTNFQTANSYQEGTIAGGVSVTASTDYYLCFLANFTGTQVVIPGTNTTANVPSIRSNFGTLTLAAQASFPASFTPSALSLNNGAFFLSAGT